MRRRAAHYKGLAAGAKRMQAMGHKTASGGGGKPPNKGCGGKKTAALILIGLGSVTLLLLAATALVIEAAYAKLM